MRLAVVSDIHGNLDALQAIVADIERRSVDAVVNLGDSLSGPLQPRETARFLMAQPWVQLAGNHERQLLDLTPERGPSDRYAHSQLEPDMFSWIAGLPHARAYDANVFLCHGTPANDLEYFLEDVEGTNTRAAHPDAIERRVGDVSASLILCGHTHVPRAVRTRRGQLILNPGSVGLPAYDDVHPTPHVIENGSPDARYAVVERVGATWSACLLAVPYDYVHAAHLASERGRPDWERALRTGYVREHFARCSPDSS